MDRGRSRESVDSRGCVRRGRGRRWVGRNSVLMRPLLTGSCLLIPARQTAAFSLIEDKTSPTHSHADRPAMDVYSNCKHPRPTLHDI